MTAREQTVDLEALTVLARGSLCDNTRAHHFRLISELKKELFMDQMHSSNLSSDALREIEAIPVVKAEPRPHQVQALADIKATFAEHDRATVVMASGTGKTLVALWAAEQEAPKTVLVLVPSLTLLQQTLLQWCKHRNKRFEYIAVCSDPTVVEEDDIDKTDINFRIDTDPAIVRQFLKRRTSNMKVIFSTYQSSPVVGEGARELPPFDLAIFDEGHRTTGYPNKFSYALSDENIRIRKRLFQTATPRHIDIHGKRNKEGEFKVYSLDDKTAYGPRAYTLTPADALYGPRAHTLTFGAAAEKGIICPYKVVIALINKQMVNDFARKHGIVLIEKDAVEVRSMANLIAVQQAVRETKAKVWGIGRTKTSGAT
jgi:predicted helicase